jgi:uncharacterized protein with gpF-like domain
MSDENWYVPFSETAKQALISPRAMNRIKLCVDQIQGITDIIKDKIFIDVMEASMLGRDIKYLVQKFNEYNIKDAYTIAMWQINNATDAISIVRQLDLGLKYNIWKYFCANQVFEDVCPNHKKYSGTVFELAKGCLIDGEYIYPGQKINCRCFSVMTLDVENR